MAFHQLLLLLHQDASEILNESTIQMLPPADRVCGSDRTSASHRPDVQEVHPYEQCSPRGPHESGRGLDTACVTDEGRSLVFGKTPCSRGKKHSVILSLL